MTHSNVVIPRAPSLEAILQQQGVAFYQSLTEQHAHLFSPAEVSISKQQLAQMESVISAVEAVVHLPAWQEADVTHTAQPIGVFYGYDFHLNAEGAHLIEINTNAGGAFLNAVLLQDQTPLSPLGSLTTAGNLEQSIVDMFRHEWRLVRGDEPLRTIAIVDEQPQQQYLYPEFLLAQQWFERSGIKAFIVDPADFEVHPEGLYCSGQRIDLIYNRLTDFSLASYPALLKAYQQQQVVISPHPAAYTRYADKRNLEKLTDQAFLKQLGVSEASIQALLQGIPTTRAVNAEAAEQWWDTRKQWFFKPVTGYGAKGAYRGDKITKRVFEEILAGDYVAQKLAPPGEVQLSGSEQALKYDVRCYVYNGEIQLIAARLYQGQTTNFRTPGGGFGVVRELA